MERYAIFLDIDGTLTAGSPVPPAENVEAIRAARAAGHLVFTNTGRAIGFVPKEVLDAVTFDGFVAGGGCYVTLGEQVLFRQTVSREALLEISALFLRTGHQAIWEGEQDTFCMNTSQPDPSWRPVTAAAQFGVGGAYDGMPVSKITMAPLTEEEKALLSRYFKVIEFPNYAEGISLGCSKALGLRKVLEATGIPVSHAIAMGDSRNDLDMLQFAGIGVAMGNAPEEVKAVADYISCDAADGGVARAIYEFVLK